MIFSSTNLGTLGHNEAGTNENEAPNTKIVMYATTVPPMALPLNIGSIKANVRWQAISNNEPIISIEAALPLRST